MFEWIKANKSRSIIYNMDFFRVLYRKMETMKLAEQVQEKWKQTKKLRKRKIKYKITCKEINSQNEWKISMNSMYEIVWLQSIFVHQFHSFAFVVYIFPFFFFFFESNVWNRVRPSTSFDCVAINFGIFAFRFIESNEQFVRIPLFFSLSTLSCPTRHLHSTEKSKKKRNSLNDLAQVSSVSTKVCLGMWNAISHFAIRELWTSCFIMFNLASSDVFFLSFSSSLRARTMHIDLFQEEGERERWAQLQLMFRLLRRIIFFCAKYTKHTLCVSFRLQLLFAIANVLCVLMRTKYGRSQFNIKFLCFNKPAQSNLFLFVVDIIVGWRRFSCSLIAEWLNEPNRIKNMFMCLLFQPFSAW